jgi:type II secretory pathway component GspD/PulD (secretin)
MSFKDPMKQLLLICLTMFATAVWGAPPQIEVIEVRSRPAADLLDSIRPLLGQHSSVSAYHDKLIVNGTPDEIVAVRSLLASLDRPSRRLIIEVRHGGGQSVSSQGLGYGVNTGNVRIGRAPPRDGATVSLQDARTRSDGDSLQRVQALDGRPALIRTGQSVPVYLGQPGWYGHRVAPGYRVDYRDVSSGFYALPRVHGNQVTIEIYQQQQRSGDRGRFDHQQASSVLRGRLGEWLTLGSIGGEDAASRNEIGLHAQTQRRQDTLIELRVVARD